MTAATRVYASTAAGYSVQNIAETITRFIHHHFLKILTMTYVLAGTLPALGLWLRSVKFGTVHWIDGSGVNLSLPLLMLAFLLFNAGLGIKTEERLLLLNYSNASTALPQMFITSDPDFLILACGTTMVICAMAFAAAWLIARLLKSDDSDKAALMFGLGMNNNGTGLVLAAAALADHPAVMLPIISYTLVQQAIAGFVDWKMFKHVD